MTCCAAEPRCRRVATWATGMQQSDRYTGALPSRHRWVSMPSLYWKFLGTRDDQADQEQIGEAQSRKIWRRWDLPVKELNRQLWRDKIGVRVWPNVSTGMRDESRSRSSYFWQRLLQVKLVLVGLPKNFWDCWCKIFYRPDAIRVTQPTLVKAVKHWSNQFTSYQYINITVRTKSIQIMQLSSKLWKTELVREVNLHLCNLRNVAAPTTDGLAD